MVNFKYYNTGASFDSTSLLTDDIAFVEDSDSLFTHGKEYKFITDAILNTKQDVLTAGAGIKIQNGVITNTVIPTTEGKEIVQVVISSDSADVSGLGLNVYYNGESDPSATYTTDEHGMCAFDVPYGYVYDIVFPTLQGYKDIPNEHHTATIIQRSVEVEYEEIDEENPEGELVKVVLQQKVNGVISNVAGATVSIAYDGVSTDYITDSLGQISIIVPYGKTYMVTAPQREGWYLHEGKYIVTYTANQTSRVVLYMYRQYESGLFIIASNGDEYTLEQWEDAVQAGTVVNNDAKLIKIFTGALAEAGCVFAIDIDMVRERSYGAYRSWATRNVLFNSIPKDGNSFSADYYYDGLTASRRVQQEGDDLGIDTLSFDQALSQSRTIATGTSSERILPGFLGAVGQWKELWQNVVEVDDILMSVRPNGTHLLSTLTEFKWTSTQGAINRAWQWGTTSGASDKVINLVVFPFFAI